MGDQPFPWWFPPLRAADPDSEKDQERPRVRSVRGFDGFLSGYRFLLSRLKSVRPGSLSLGGSDGSPPSFRVAPRLELPIQTNSYP